MGSTASAPSKHETAGSAAEDSPGDALSACGKESWGVLPGYAAFGAMLLSPQAGTARLVSDTYLAKLLEGLSSLRSQGALCDVTLEAEGVCFPAHKIVLASASNYCKILFVGNVTRAGSPDGNVRLKAVSAAGLRNVLNFIYSNKLDLSLQNIEETFKAAEILLVREVIQLCFRFLEGCLNGENCMDVLNIAKKLGPAELRQKAMCCVGQHYKQILADPQCLKDLDRETLCEILDRTDTAGCSELELFRAAVSWLQHDRTRLKDAADVLRRVRFPLIPLRELQSCVQEMPLMRLDSGCRRYLQEALNYHSQPYAQPVLQSRSTNLRSGSAVLLVAGGRAADNCVCREMWAADQSCSTWHKVGDLCVPVYNHCVAVVGGFLFVIGGQRKFDPTGKQPSNEVGHEKPLALAKWLGEEGRESLLLPTTHLSTSTYFLVLHAVLKALGNTASKPSGKQSGPALVSPCSYCKLSSSSGHNFHSTGSARSMPVSRATPSLLPLSPLLLPWDSRSGGTVKA